MLRLPTQIRTTGSDSLSSVGAGATVISESSAIFATDVEEASARAARFRDDQLITLEATAVRRLHVAILKRWLDSARGLCEMEKKLDADPELREIYEALDGGDFAFERSKR